MPKYTQEDIDVLNAEIERLTRCCDGTAEQERNALQVRVRALEELLQRAVDGDSEGSWMQEVRALLATSATTKR